MLIRVSPKKASLGMYVHGLDGNWADWPFWQTGFVLNDPADVAKLRESRVTSVIVDTEKSIGPAPKSRSRSEPPTRFLHYCFKSLSPEKRRAARMIARASEAVLRLTADVRLGRLADTERLIPIVNDLAEEVAANAAALFDMLRIKDRDHYTYVHSVAVAALMINLARTMGLDEAEVPQYGLAGLTHDIGKISVPETILKKPGALTEEEFELMRSHPLAGRAILTKASHATDMMIDVCLHHHERPDGRGYPYGLGADALSLAARMGAVCDVYDALTSDRPYKDAWSPQKALAGMCGWTGQFDPDVLHAFLQSLRIYPAGTLVRLRNSALAVVLADNGERPDCPTIRSFYSIASRSRVVPEDVTVQVPEALTLERPGDWGFEDWPALSRELLAF
jgi:HD-GYP domain-containing protein (c-di-GMP phosphodiesterase class II)